MAGMIKSDDIVLELGAGIGVTTCLAAKMTHRGKIIAFEANPEIGLLARRHLKLNKVQNAEIINGVLDHTSGARRFYCSKHFLESSMTPNDDFRKIEIEALDMRREISNLCPTVILMDIEGGEYSLLNWDVRRDCDSIRAISVEFHKTAKPDSAIPRDTLFSLERDKFEPFMD